LNPTFPHPNAHPPEISSQKLKKKKLIASIHKAIELKPNKLEINFSHKKVDKDLTFAMMIKKVEKKSWWGIKWGNIQIVGCF